MFEVLCAIGNALDKVEKNLHELKKDIDVKIMVALGVVVLGLAFGGIGLLVF